MNPGTSQDSPWQSWTCPRMSQDSCVSIYIIFHVVFIMSPASPSKGGGVHPAFSSTPFTYGEGPVCGSPGHTYLRGLYVLDCNGLSWDVPGFIKMKVNTCTFVRGLSTEEEGDSLAILRTAMYMYFAYFESYRNVLHFYMKYLVIPLWSSFAQQNHRRMGMQQS